LDDGTIPGDGKGAGGFDSSLFSHLYRNWYIPVKAKKVKYPMLVVMTRAVEPKLKFQAPDTSI